MPTIKSTPITIEINCSRIDYQNIDGTIDTTYPVDTVYLGEGEELLLSDVGRVKLSAALRAIFE
jgi:hypothetical protein